MNPKIVDHLFRHHYGKMVSILTRIFGLSNIELIEDAIQDTFAQALLKWRNQIPDNPEAWLTRAAKNRAIDLLRQIKNTQKRFEKIKSGPSTIQFNELFLDHEIEDSQLQMIFVACHPSLHPREQIAFALKTISGFSTKEIASALLINEDTISKRLNRARKKIIEKSIKFDFPGPEELPKRMNRVMEVVYLTFNEGFHSNNQKILIRKDLCGEAIRLCKLLLKKEKLRSGKLYALFALMCFHASRLESKVSADNEIIDLRHQNRSSWSEPLIALGNSAMQRAIESETFSLYHFEAAIAWEHVTSPSFEATNWQKILQYYKGLNALQFSEGAQLNIAVVHLQLGEYEAARDILEEINVKELRQRGYLYYGCFAEYYRHTNNVPRAIAYLDKTILKVSNELERDYLIKKREELKG